MSSIKQWRVFTILTHLLEPEIKDLTFEWLSTCDFFQQGEYIHRVDMLLPSPTKLRFLSLLEPQSSAFCHKAALDAVPFWEDWEMRQCSLSTNALLQFMNGVVDGTCNAQPHSNILDLLNSSWHSRDFDRFFMLFAANAANQVLGNEMVSVE